MTTESRKLAQFALDLKLADVPQDTQDLAKEHLLDALGIAFASASTMWRTWGAHAGLAAGDPAIPNVQIMVCCAKRRGGVQRGQCTNGRLATMERGHSGGRGAQKHF